MSQLNTKIKLYAKSKGVNSIDFLTDVVLEQSGGEAVIIKEWNLSIAEPTVEQLNSFETAANKEEANNIIISTRKTAYGPWDKQLEEIYDNGIDSWKARILQIKTDNPKS